MTASAEASNWAGSAVPQPGHSVSSMVDWFGSGHYAPHGFCMFWDPTLIALYWLGNGGVALAYVLIPAMLLYVVWSTRKKTGIHRWALIEFAAFIFCCAISHVLQIVNLYVGAYWFEAVWLNITAFVSLLTAVTLPFGVVAMIRQATRSTVERIIRVPGSGD